MQNENNIYDSENQARQSNEPQPGASACPDTLLATKFLIPTSSHEVIARPHLQALLNEGLSRRLILLSAAAGFGKTTLLAQWVRSLPPGHPSVAWVSLDSGDNVPFQFWSYVLAALEQCQPGISQQPFATMHDASQPSWQAVLTALVNSLATRDTPLVLVLDNYEEITEPTIHALLSSLLKHSPPTLCLVLATRTDPPFSLAWLRAQAQILELRAAQLRATREEIALFLQDIMDLRLSEQSIQDVDTHIQGWWAAIQLTALALQKQTVISPKDLLHAFQGSQPAFFEYLVQEVLHRQPSQVQAFLLRTSILPQLCNSLCDAVLEQQESQLFLEELERDNLFLNPLDKQHQWYAYHPFFAEVLRAQLERNAPKEVPALHLRASQWYAAHRMHSEAIQQALLAQEWAWAAQLMEQLSSQHIWGRFKDALLLSWIEQLPREVVRERPRLCLACAQSQFWITPPGSTESWLRTAREAWKATHQQVEKTNKTQSTRELDAPLSLLGEIAALQATIASFYYGDAGAAQAFCQEALTHLQEPQWAAKIQVTYAQSRANIAQGHFERSMQHIQTGLSRIRSEGDHPFAMIYLWEIVWGKMMAGHLHEAWQLSQQLLHTHQNDMGHQPMRVCWPYIYQASILYEWNRLEEAQDLTEQAVQVGEQAELVAFLPCGYTMLLKLALSQERWEEAHKIIRQMAYIGHMLSSPYHAALWSCVDQMRFWLARGDLTQARRWARDLQREAPLVSSLAREKQSIALARLLLAESQPQYVLNILDPLVERAEAMQRLYSILEMLLLQVNALDMLQQPKEASVILARAVHLGASENYIQRFVDEGPVIRELLSQLGEQEQCEEDRLYMQRLLSAFDQKQETRPSPRESELLLPLLDPLSAREQEVLQLLAHGASNQDIAEALVISPGTVKHHVSNILSKLEAANRTQAVARARKLGLLSAEE